MSRSQDSCGISRRFRQAILPRHWPLRGHLQARHTLRRLGILDARRGSTPESEIRRRYGLRNSMRTSLPCSFLRLMDALSETISANSGGAERPRNLDVETVVWHEKPIVPTVELVDTRLATFCSVKKPVMVVIVPVKFVACDQMLTIGIGTRYHQIVRRPIGVCRPYDRLARGVVERLEIDVGGCEPIELNPTPGAPVIQEVRVAHPFLVRDDGVRNEIRDVNPDALVV